MLLVNRHAVAETTQTPFLCWQPNKKTTIELYMEEKGYYMLVKIGGEIKRIPETDIKGFSPSLRTGNLEAKLLFQKESHVVLHPTSSGSYTANILMRGRGGIMNPEEIQAAFLCIDCIVKTTVGIASSFINCIKDLVDSCIHSHTEIEVARIRTEAQVEVSKNALETARIIGKADKEE